MTEINLNHLSLTISGASFLVLLRVAYKFGQFMLQFEELRARVKYHDKLLHVPNLDGE